MKHCINNLNIFRPTIIAENGNISESDYNSLDYDNTSTIFIHKVRILICLVKLLEDYILIYCLINQAIIKHQIHIYQSKIKNIFNFLEY